MKPSTTVASTVHFRRRGASKELHTGAGSPAASALPLPCTPTVSRPTLPSATGRHGRNARDTVEGPIHFRRRGQGACKELQAGAAANIAPASGRVPRLARLMALALRCEELVRSGQVKNLAELARLGHVSRARISQIMSLVQLAPDLQEELLFRNPPERGRDPWHLRLLLPVAAVLCWRDQRRRWRRLPRP